MLQVQGGGPPAQRLPCGGMSRSDAGPASGRNGRRLEALGFAAAVALALLLLYLIHPAMQGYRYPIGPDGPVYTWLARLAGASGFGDMPGGGPGVPGLTLTLGSILRTDPVQTVMLLGPVLATACGLAAGALLEATLGEDRIRAAVGALLTGAFTAFLAGGWLANVAMVAVFLAALAALSASATSRRAVGAGAGLLLAAGLTHRVFVGIGAGILLGVAAWELAFGRSAERRGAGLRLGAAALAGPGAALLLGTWIASGPGVPGDSSQDGFFRRVGLRGLLLDRYRERFAGDLTRASVPLLAGAGLSWAWARRPSDRAPARFLRLLLSSWLVLTLVGVAVLAVTGWGPPYRLVQFAFFLPVAAAAGFAILADGSRVLAALAWLGVILFSAFALTGWFRQAPAFSPEELASAAQAGAVTDALPEGTPLVFVVDTAEPAAAYHVARASNVIRMGISAERIRDVRLVVGAPADVLASRPTLTGDLEHDQIARQYMREAAHVLDEGMILLLRALNERGYAQALDIDHAFVLADGLLALTEGRYRLPTAVGGSGSPGLSILQLFLLSFGALLALGFLGRGWASWALPVLGPRGLALATPSVGVAVAVLGTVGADRIGLLPGGAGSLAITAALAVGGYVIAARSNH
jgi:hypothetical protein